MPAASETGLRARVRNKIICPECGAGLGEYCIRPNGSKPSNHSQRWDLWLEKESEIIWGSRTQGDID